MSVLPVRIYGDSVLRKRARPVANDEPGLSLLVENMLNTMRAENGLGLAAPQIGESVRVAVIDRRGTEDGEEDLVMVNPEITVGWGHESSEEGCLSLPEIWVKVKRSSHVKLAYSDLSGRRQSLTASGRFAVAIQHELDHLDGVLLIDRISSVERGLLKGKLDALKARSRDSG
jgi:peptide deformylase